MPMANISNDSKKENWVTDGSWNKTLFNFAFHCKITSIWLILRVQIANSSSILDSYHRNCSLHFFLPLHSPSNSTILCHAPSQKTTERSRQAEAPTTKAANNVGRKKSKRVLIITVSSGKHTTSLGKSTGILTNSLPLHGWENNEDGDVAPIKAIAGANEAKTTVKTKRTVHMAA